MQGVTIKHCADMVPDWLVNVTSPEEAKDMLAKICAIFDVFGATIYEERALKGHLCWRLALSSTKGDVIKGRQRLNETLQILEQGLPISNQAMSLTPTIVQTGAFPNDANHQILFIPARSSSGEKMVFVFESHNRISFATIAELHLLVDVLHANFIHNDIFDNAPAALRQQLSALEINFIQLKAFGLSDDETSQKLNLSSHVLNSIWQSAIHKLDCPNAFSAIAKAVRLNLLP